MTVAETIELLRRFPQDAEVFADNQGDIYVRTKAKYIRKRDNWLNDQWWVDMPDDQIPDWSKPQSSSSTSVRTNP